MFKHLLAGAAALVVATAANAQTFAIQAGRLIVDAAQAERGPSTVIVENGRISRIETGFTAPAGAIVIDERSRTVLPGMTDAHVHLTEESGENFYLDFFQDTFRQPAEQALLASTFARKTLDAGFTTVRNVGASDYVDVGLRNAINKGYVPGPRMLVAVHAISATGGMASALTARYGASSESRRRRLTSGARIA